MSEWDDLTPAAIANIAWEAQEGTADPRQAKRLIALFSHLVATGARIPAPLLTHLGIAFTAYLDDKKPLESALGLKRKRGRTRHDADMRTKMAAAVLRLRIVGKNHQDALDDTADKYGWTASIIGEAWAEYQQDAYTLLRLERLCAESAWTEPEKDRLAAIFKKARWFTAPE